MPTGSPVVSGPPTLKGDKETDFWSYIQWLAQFYKSLVLEGGVGQIAGEFTVSGNATFSDVAFPQTIAAQGDNGYLVTCSAVGSTGGPNDNAFIVASVTLKTTAGCRIGLRGAPGVGKSVTFNYSLSRPF